jgi:sterol 3beta-glucosyltransferase
VGEKLDVPCFRALFAPFDATREFPAMTEPNLPFGGWYNKMTFKGGDILWSNATRNLLNDWRVHMGLRDIKPFEFPYRHMNGSPIPTLYAYSAILAPKPKEYGEHLHITGFWIQEIETAWKPDAKLADFLESGTKPIYIGFGSMVGADFKRMLHVIAESQKQTGQRALLSSGWGNLGGLDSPDNIMQIGSVPHEWLFRRCLPYRITAAPELPPRSPCRCSQYHRSIRRRSAILGGQSVPNGDRNKTYLVQEAYCRKLLKGTQ